MLHWPCDQRVHRRGAPPDRPSGGQTHTPARSRQHGLHTRSTHDSCHTAVSAGLAAIKTIPNTLEPIELLRGDQELIDHVTNKKLPEENAKKLKKEAVYEFSIALKERFPSLNLLKEDAFIGSDIVNRGTFEPYNRRALRVAGNAKPLSLVGAGLLLGRLPAAAALQANGTMMGTGFSPAAFFDADEQTVGLMARALCALAGALCALIGAMIHATLAVPSAGSSPARKDDRERDEMNHLVIDIPNGKLEAKWTWPFRASAVAVIISFYKLCFK